MGSVSHVEMRSPDYSIVILGDSIAAGVGASSPIYTLEQQFLKQIKKKHPGADIENFAVAGARIADVVKEQLPKLDSLTPKLAILVIGGNDLIKGTLLKQFHNSLKETLERLSSISKHVIVLNVPKISLLPVTPVHLKLIAELKTKRFNHIFHRTAELFSNVLLFDMYQFSHTHLHSEEELLAEDQFHPNNRAYQLLAQELHDALNKRYY